MKILVPTDFSDIAEFGLQVARDIAVKSKADIYLINYIEPLAERDFSATGDGSTTNFEEQAYMIELTKRNSQLIHNLALKYEDNDINIRPVIEVDHFENAMEHFIKEKDIDLVVMGTSGERSFDELIFGNHTERVIRISNCPVLSVKSYAKKFDPVNMVMVIDLESEEPFKFKFFKDFANLFGATIHFLYVTKNKKHATEKLKARMDTEAKAHGFVDFTIDIRVSRRKEEAVIDFAKEQNADLVGVAKKSKNSLINLFFGSFTEEIIKEEDAPVLTLTGSRNV